MLGALHLAVAHSHGQLLQPPEYHVFTDVEGRKVSAEMLEAGETSITVKLKTGKKFQIELARLSADDKLWVTNWVAGQAAAKKKSAEEEAAKKRAAEIPVKTVEFCKSKLDQQVGNGECWTLADEAFQACGLKRPGEDIRVWGRQLNLKMEKPQPGDIVEYRSARFRNGNYTGPEHTSVVVKAGRRSTVTIAEQNWGGRKTVKEAELDLNGLVSGEIMIYRPQ
ncbi:MAG: CHAP domain-containing protein [Verrucomicrobiales bacterium]